MGLDMYAFRVANGADLPVVDAEFAEDQAQQIAYWRKHPDLHGWMEQLYRQKGGAADSFNCKPVEVTLEDLDQLEAAVAGKALPSTTGFFFGQSSPGDAEDDRKFISVAREAIREGERVFYDSWW